MIDPPPDPYTNAWDLGADPMKFARDRTLLAEELLGKLAERGADKGEGYQRTRQAFGILLQEYGNATHLIANFVGGVRTHRDHAGDPGGRDPFVVVSPARQREALKFLREHVLTDRPFHFPPRLLRRLGADRWLHWGNEEAIFGGVDYPVHERVLAIQRIALDHALSPATLRRVQNNSLSAEEGAKERPLALAEVFRSLTDGIWSDAPASGKGGKRALATSGVRRNLQREHLKDLARLVLGGGPGTPPADARSLARTHLREIDGRIGKVLGEKDVVVEETTRAHLEECRERIAKVLGASMRVSGP